MSDVYANFAALRRSRVEGRDYRIVVRPGAAGCDTAVIAPHGGAIEPHTSLVAAAVAGADLGLYCFEGRMRHGNAGLHVTSENFDEPGALALVKTAARVVAIHGRKDRGAPATVEYGGKDAQLAARIAERLERAGFRAMRSPRLPGLAETNIVNRGATGRGVQLELPFSLRDRLAAEPDLLAGFASAVRSVIHQG